MSNTSAEWWSIDDVSLHQHGWSVATVGGSRYDLPPRRGDNIVLAARPGQMWRPKQPDQRTINLVMWVTGMDPDTGQATDNPVLRWNDSWDFLRRLVWKPNGAQITLTRRWLLTQDGSPTLLLADAQAAVTDTMSPTMTGRARADFTMSLVMADPFFYGPTITLPTLNIDDQITVLNPGHDIAGWSGGMTIDFLGPVYRPLLFNYTPTPQVWLRYLDTIDAGDTVRLSIPDYTATRLSDGANVISKVSHFGAQYWWGLLPLPNANVVRFTSDNPTVDTGTCVVSYRPPYI